MSGRGLTRKLYYLAPMVLLLVPLSMLGQPATVDVVAADGQLRQGSQGGKLAQLRRDYRLGQANVGKIDPASLTIKLCMLGLDSVASAILWQQAAEYKKVEDWTRLGTVVEQLKQLQPHYVQVWKYLAWDISYNVSAEFDDLRDKYYWVIRGMEFLQEGTEYNRSEPELLHEVGMFSDHKLGGADERFEYRRMFFTDDEFHKRQTVVHERDNYQFAKGYFRKAEELVDSGEGRMRTGSLLIFHSQPAMSQRKYAIALEREGCFDQPYREIALAGPAAAPSATAAADENAAARDAWRVALQDWRQYAERAIPKAAGPGEVRLGDLDALQRQLDETVARLDALAPGVRQRLRNQKFGELPPEELAAYQKPARARTAEEARYAEAAEFRTRVSDREVAEQVGADRQREARQLVEQIERLSDDVAEIRRNREIVNYEYWLERCVAEAAPEALEARRLLYLAIAANRDGDPWSARDYFERGFARWRQILDRNPRLLDDQTAYEIYMLITGEHGYQSALKWLDQPFPADFPLQALLDLQRAKNQ